MTRKTKRKLKMIGMFVLPVALVKITASMLGVAPEAASAEAPAPLAAMTAAEGPQWTSKQYAAAKFIEASRSDAFGPTPFFYETQKSVEGPITNNSLPPSIEVNPDLQMLMGSGSGATALIDDKVYRVGGVLWETDWVVEGIDVNGRTVMLRHRGTDRTMRLSPGEH